jgi:hypothetical protein
VSGEREVMVWHDESERLTTWGTLDPPDACMCRECVLGQGETGRQGRSEAPRSAEQAESDHGCPGDGGEGARGEA